MSKTVPAICRECGMHAKITFKATTIETTVTDKISTCHQTFEGMTVVSCPSLKQEIAAVLRTHMSWDGADIEDGEQPGRGSKGAAT
jgi:coenzyme F420-reducing hydrogenase beta subunit